MSELGTKILNGLEIGASGFDNVDAITLMHDLVLSKDQMRTVRQYLIKKRIFFPSTTMLLELKPVVDPILNNKGVTVNKVELVTTASVFDVVAEKEDIDKSSEFVMHYKSGGDGAGSQTVWKRCSTKNAAADMFQYSLSPLKLTMVKDDINRVIWKNSANWMQPIMLIRDKEGADLLNHVLSMRNNLASEQNTQWIML